MWSQVPCGASGPEGELGGRASGRPPPSPRLLGGLPGLRRAGAGRGAGEAERRGGWWGRSGGGRRGGPRAAPSPLTSSRHIASTAAGGRGACVCGERSRACLQLPGAAGHAQSRSSGPRAWCAAARVCVASVATPHTSTFEVVAEPTDLGCAALAFPESLGPVPRYCFIQNGHNHGPPWLHPEPPGIIFQYLPRCRRPS